MRCGIHRAAGPAGLSSERSGAEVANLHYADTPEYATGHGVSADWEIVAGGACRRVRTIWFPRAEVEKIETAEIQGAELSMETLGGTADEAAVERMLGPLVTGYRAWIAAQRAAAQRLDEDRRKTAEQLLRQAGLAADRMERGIAILGSDEDVLDAFRMANRAVVRALGTRIRD